MRERENSNDLQDFKRQLENDKLEDSRKLQSIIKNYIDAHNSLSSAQLQEVYFTAVKSNWKAISFVPKEICNMEIIFAALDQTPKALKKIPVEHINDEMIYLIIDKYFNVATNSKYIIPIFDKFDLNNLSIRNLLLIFKKYKEHKYGSELDFFYKIHHKIKPTRFTPDEWTNLYTECVKINHYSLEYVPKKFHTREMYSLAGIENWYGMDSKHYDLALNNPQNFIDMKNRFHHWFSKERLNEKINDKNLKIAAWLFSFYYELLWFFQRKNLNIDDQLLLYRFNEYVEGEAFRLDLNLDNIKYNFMPVLNRNISSFINECIFDIHELKQYGYKYELKKLLEALNKREDKFNKEDFDFRISLKLSSRYDYYRAKKIIMNYCHNKKDNSILTKELISKIINKNRKFKFYLDLQDDETLQKLITDVSNELNKKTEFENNLLINKFVNIIQMASTPKGSIPVRWRQSDFWNLNDQWVRKIKKYKNIPFENKVYANYDCVKNGLDYINEELKKLSVKRLDTLCHCVVKKIKDGNEDFNNLTSNSDIAIILLNKIKQSVNSLNENARKIALLSIINGYLDIYAKSKPFDGIKDKTIELLILQELHELTQKLTSTQKEKKVELIYRSCVDLMSTMIASRLHIYQDQFTQDKNVIFPKLMRQSVLEKYSSNILVKRRGMKAIEEGLRILDKNLSNHMNKNWKPPGFLQKTVLSQGNPEEYKKDVAVYFEIGDARGKAREPDENDTFAFVGRISETIFDISQDELIRLTKDVSEWCQDGPKKTLCMDLTITKPDDELFAWIQSPEVIRLIEEGKLDILVWQSEQKQHSLGTGKFSAGTCYLISNDKVKVDAFNQCASKSYKEAPDNNLSTFFRHYCTDAMHEVVKQQSESAKLISDLLNPMLEKYNAKAVANGAFVTIIADNLERSDISSLLEKKWPKSSSFGFSQTTVTYWDDSSIRISVGLEPKETLIQEVAEIISKSKAPRLDSLGR